MCVWVCVRGGGESSSYQYLLFQLFLTEHAPFLLASTASLFFTDFFSFFFQESFKASCVVLRCAEPICAEYVVP